jgi:hypothetical protein
MYAAASLRHLLRGHEFASDEVAALILPNVRGLKALQRAPAEKRDKQAPGGDERQRFSQRGPPARRIKQRARGDGARAGGEDDGGMGAGVVGSGYRALSALRPEGAAAQSRGAATAAAGRAGAQELRAEVRHIMNARRRVRRVADQGRQRLKDAARALARTWSKRRFAELCFRIFGGEKAFRRAAATVARRLSSTASISSRYEQSP